MIATDQITGEQRPSSGAFKPDDDGVSVYSQIAMIDRSLTLQDLRVTENNVFVTLAVTDIRRIQPLDAVGDPWPNYSDSDARDAAHALIVGWDGLSKKEKKNRQDHLVQIAAFV